MVSVVIVQHNHADLTAAAVASLHQTHGEGVDVIVVDNGSNDAGMTDGRLGPCTVLRSGENRGFGAANNAGARAARGDTLLFLNNDTIVRDPILPRIEEYFAATPVCGVAGLQILNPDGSPQNSTGADPRIWSIWQTSRKGYFHAPRATVRRDWVSGAALAVRRDVFEKAGGFDESYFMYYEDVDLCARIRRLGHEIHLIDAGRIVHLKGGSQPGGMPPALEKEFRNSQIRYYARYAPGADRLLLRLYLILRYLPTLLFGTGDARAVASHVVSLACGPADAYRH